MVPKIKLNRKIYTEKDIYATMSLVSNPSDPVELIAENILYELWYSVAESIFKKVCDVTQLDEEQREALRQVALRPNDFQIQLV
jgi:hypothetical protein